MTLDALLFQALNGLAAASGLFFVGAGLSLIFGVTRIVNIAHGSLYMLGIYIAYSIATKVGGGLGFWGSLILAPLMVAAIGAVIEVVLLRRIYQAPELFQLLATFAVLLVINDATLWIWGNEDLFGPRAPGLRGSVEILDRRFPTYDLFLIVVGPVVLLACIYLLQAKTRFGRLIRAATQDREMVGALGVNQALLFTAVFALGSFLAGLGGALQLAREPANLAMDLTVIGDAFVVVVVGGMGSITGAYLAAVIIAEIKALCIGIGVVNFGGFTVNFSKLTLVAEFLVMAVVLIVRPYGLLGRPADRGAQHLRRGRSDPPGLDRAQARRPRRADRCSCCSPLLEPHLSLRAGARHRRADRRAVRHQPAFHHGAGRHAFVRPRRLFRPRRLWGRRCWSKFFARRMPVALLVAPLAAGAGALLFGWFAVRLSGVYLAMLTLAFAQIVWSIVFQWEDVTGGSNGIVGIWPTAPFTPALDLLPAHARPSPSLGVLLLRRMLFAPFGYAMRAGRDSPLRAEAIGIDVKRVHWIAFAIAGTICGVAGGLFAFAKGSISPETIAVGRSVDGLVMVLLGGIQTLIGPIVGASVFVDPAGHHHAPDRVLARDARRHHPAAGAGVPRRHRRHARQVADCGKRETVRR